jgi:AcrR family transcriptional regulator
LASTSSTTPRQRNRRGEGDQLRAELLAAADALLEERGDVADVTVRGVAAAVGVAPNAVYLHFPNRDALLAELAVARYRTCTASLRAAVAGIHDPLEQLYVGHETYCRLALEQPGHYRLLFHGLVHPTDPALLQRVAEAGLAYFQTCIDCCQACLDAGVLVAPDAATLAGAVWSLEHGWCEIALTGDVGASIVPSAREALRLLLEASRRPS